MSFNLIFRLDLFIMTLLWKNVLFILNCTLASQVLFELVLHDFYFCLTKQILFKLTTWGQQCCVIIHALFDLEIEVISFFFVAWIVIFQLVIDQFDMINTFLHFWFYYQTFGFVKKKLFKLLFISFIVKGFKTLASKSHLP